MRLRKSICASQQSYDQIQSDARYLSFNALLARSQVISSARASRKTPVKGKKAAARVLNGRLLLYGPRGRDALCPTASNTSKISRREGLHSGARVSRLPYLPLHQPHGFLSDRIKERANELGVTAEERPVHFIRPRICHPDYILRNK